MHNWMGSKKQRYHIEDYSGWQVCCSNMTNPPNLAPSDHREREKHIYFILPFDTCSSFTNSLENKI